MFRKVLEPYLKIPLFKNLSLVILARFSNAFLFFVVTFLLMKFLSAEEYGKFNDFYSSVAVFTFLVNLGLDKSFVTATSKIVNKDRFLNYVGLFWRLKLCAFCIFCVSFLIFYIFTKNHYLVIVALTGFTFGLSEGIKPLAEAQKKFNIISALVPIRNLILIISLGILSLTNYFKLNNIFFFFLGSNILNFALFFIAYKSKISNFTLKTTLKSSMLLRFTKWLFVKDFFTVLVANLEILVMARLIERGLVEPVELGVYAGAFSLCRILSVATNSLTNVLLPEVVEKTNKQSLIAFLRKLKKSTLITLPLTLIFFFVMIFVSRLLFGTKYIESEVIFPLVLIGILLAFYANNASLIFYRSKSLSFIGVLTIAKLILGLLLSLAMIPKMGAIGAGLSFLLVRLFDLMMVSFRSKKILNNPLKQL